MIDGVKILCNLNPTDWTNNKSLSFRSWIDTATGEMPRNNKHATTNGLHLSIIEGEKETFCNVRGSLPKYYTNGETNAYDYDFRDFLNTCDQLNQNLNICPKTAILRGFEFGVNIDLPLDFSNIYECIKSYKQHAYSQYTENGKTLGIVFQFQQYKIKIYDKGMQKTGKKSRLMRFEIEVNKMAWVKRLEAKTLADLQNTGIWLELSKILLTVWSDIIFVDKYLKYRPMTNHEQKKYLRYFDTHYWTGLNKKQYFTAKNHLSKLRAKYGTENDLKTKITALIFEKLQKLATDTLSENGYFLTEWESLRNTLGISENSNPLKNQNRVLFNHLDKGLNTVTNYDTSPLENHTKTIRNNLKENSKKKKPKKLICMNCKKSLKEKKATAKFCSLKCKNQHNGLKRTKANQKRRMNEKKWLGKILKNLPKTDLALLVIYKTDGLQYADHLKQSEINAPPEWIRQIAKVLIISDKTAPPLELTTVRGKRLIKEITNINQLNNLTK